MRRIALDDGGWFDASKAIFFEEDERWDGQNYISVATGSQWDHERLYRTAGGSWILHWRSQWQGTRPSWTEISADEAARWLVRNGKPTKAAAKAIADLEIK